MRTRTSLHVVDVTDAIDSDADGELVIHQGDAITLEAHVRALEGCTGATFTGQVAFDGIGAATVNPKTGLARIPGYVVELPPGAARRLVIRAHYQPDDRHTGPSSSHSVVVEVEPMRTGTGGLAALLLRAAAERDELLELLYGPADGADCCCLAITRGRHCYPHCHRPADGCAHGAASGVAQRRVGSPRGSC